MGKPISILGINAFHGDAAACLVQDGQLVAAVEEERFTRIKHWAGFPHQAVRYCLEVGGVAPADLHHVALSANPKANLGPKAWFALQHPAFPGLRDRARRQQAIASVQDHLSQALGGAEIAAKVHSLEHHSTHLALAFFLSPFEKAALMSVDGMGDFVSLVLGAGEGQRLQYFQRTHFPHSLGYLYNALTLYLGFPNYGDEYKVMGLAPYGQPTYLEAMRRLIAWENGALTLNLEYFTHHRQGIAMTWDEGLPVVQPFHSEELIRLLGPARSPQEELTQHHRDLAASLQAVTEEIVFAALRDLHRRYPDDRLCLAGGVAMNSVANGKIRQHTPFREVYVPVGAADNGTCIGAAFYVWHRLLEQPRQFRLDRANWGPAFPDAECAQAIAQAGLTARRYEDPELWAVVVDALLAGQVVGWFQGRMEFGARALGHRSLLADPRRADMRDIINARIKFRELFRPFAPSILEEHVADFFEHPTAVPFMEKVLPVRPDKRDLIPAVTHVDGTGRLQTVSRHTNPRYWQLIRTFADRTGIPLLLNTSLNENEPVVCRPAEAIACFQRTQMDMLVLENHVIAREEM
jgi:carbamoyltransferase